jgi:HEAT repeat protein
MVSAQKRLVEYHIGRLRDKNPEVRLKAIGELALLADTDALEALESVFKNDTNSDVRKAAQEAGRSVFLKLKEQEQRDNPT